MMETTTRKRSAVTRLLLWCVFLSALAGRGVQAGDGMPSVSLHPVGHPQLAAAVVWNRGEDHDGLIRLDRESGLFEAAATDGSSPLLLHVRAQPGARVAVRQRSVTYLNVGDEGPHVDVPGTEQRGAWSPLDAAAHGVFRVREPVTQPLAMRRAHIAKALADDARWRDLAAACPGPDAGACYTVTDPEFEITFTAPTGTVRRAIVRVFFPNGC
ncbi:hypothetical protein [Massilia sp. Leaf139]|uniref:hypothetical protein n=1 Tax=Massilia sp. Leaf139 TaxID=1736272 RepID=UPI0006F4A26B|nr:hypothetical protein [Massilia sp. Leaf139]KQQ91814.1 hypothetical protein ASF77_07740 [Massilia sp. Leaf139]